MRFGSIILAAVMPVALGACGDRDSSTSPDTNSATVAESAASNAVAPVASAGAQDFVNKAAASDRFEIETSKLVASSAASTAVMAFAREMIAAHTASTAKLKAAAAKDPTGIAVNDELSASQKAALEDLKMKKGYIFDAAYIAAQVHGHEQALSELKNYAASGDNAELKAFAQSMVPAATEHLSKAQGLTGSK